jgi:hypothetical protein
VKLVKNKKSFPDLAIFISVFVILLIIAMNLNFPGGKPKMGGEIWSDKAGYYVYLPAAFIYHFNASNFPDGIETKTGNGFSLNMQDNTIHTKYTSGVSILVAPFFLMAHVAATSFNLEPDGFSIIYQKMVIAAGVFYLVLGLFFLKKVLDNYFRSWISYITLLFLFTGTNLYFYGLDDVLMSHVYSFFLFSLLLYLLKIYLDKQEGKQVHFILLCIVSFLLVLIRPTNVVLLFVVLFFDVRTMKDFRNRVSLFVRPGNLIILFVTGFLIFLPQMLYWKRTFGAYVHYTYVGEGFTNWLHPRILEIWFSPINGLFLYNPILVFIIAGIVLMIFRKIPNGIFIFLFFLFITYVFSSWCVWYYGGCYGSRPFVDFYALLGIPLGYLVNYVFTGRRIILKIIFPAFLVLFSFVNIKMIYNFQCFTGSTWGWHDFLQTLDRSGLYNLERSSYIYIDDFENITMDDGIPKTITKSHSGSLSTYMIENIPYNCIYTRKAGDIIRHKIIKKVELSVWINPKFFDSTGAQLVSRITGIDGSTVFSKIIRANDQGTRNNQWTEIRGTFELPAGLDPEDLFTFYIRNPEKKRFYIDDLKIKFN